MKKIIFFLSFALTPFFMFSDEEETGGIEEVIVTAERQASSIQDTAISITAFDSTLIEALNLRNQEDLQNYIPATTIQPYDISIRGIGRMFRALGGDEFLIQAISSSSMGATQFLLIVMLVMFIAGFFIDFIVGNNNLT